MAGREVASGGGQTGMQALVMAEGGAEEREKEREGDEKETRER